MAKYTFEDFVEKANWDDGSQAGAMFEFINSKGLKDQFDEFLSEKYGWELEEINEF